MALIFIARDVNVLFYYLVIVFILYRLCQYSLKVAIGNFRPFTILFVLTIGLHSFFTPGKILLQIPFVNMKITYEGIYQGIFYTVRIGLLILIASLLTLTTSPMALTDAIERFLSPFRRIGIPDHEIALMISISLRFIPTLIEEADRIRKAQLSRGSRFDGSLIRRLQSIIPIVIPLFISTLRRANDLAIAMDARCYRGGEGRTKYDILKFRIQDILAMAFVILLGTGFIFIRLPLIYQTQ